MRTEPKKSTAARMATPTAATVDRPLNRIEKRRYMLYVMSRAITTQELSTRTSIPAILATRQDVPNIAVSSSRRATRRSSWRVILTPGMRAGVAHTSSLRPGGVFASVRSLAGTPASGPNSQRVLGTERFYNGEEPPPSPPGRLLPAPRPRRGCGRIIAGIIALDAFAGRWSCRAGFCGGGRSGLGVIATASPWPLGSARRHGVSGHGAPGRFSSRGRPERPGPCPPAPRSLRSG
jgi:hypothetical protein